MKKGLIIAMMAFTMTSCFTTHLYEPHWSAEVVDYSMLTDKGIYVNESDKINFEYQTLASVETRSIGGYVNKEKADNIDQKSINDIYYQEEKSKKAKANGFNKEYVAPKYDEALGVMALKLEELGANGIINLKIRVEVGELYDKIIVTGTAIKR
jgi:uncharacterized protein YbjQ (UPF0145 family)